MTTLAAAPVAAVIDRLFEDAAANPPQARMEQARLSPEALDHLMRSKTDYADLYGQMKDLALPVSRETGHLLYMLARSCGVRVAVEFGTSFGVSTLHLAAALRDNGGGQLIGSEFEPSKAARARTNLTEAGLADLVDIREGDALWSLASRLPETVDLLLLDGAKALYADVLELVEPRLRPGAFVIADNTDYSPDYIARVRDPASGYLSVPFGGGVELSMRL